MMAGWDGVVTWLQRVGWLGVARVCVGVWGGCGVWGVGVGCGCGVRRRRRRQTASGICSYDMRICYAHMHMIVCYAAMLCYARRLGEQLLRQLHAALPLAVADLSIA